MRAIILMLVSTLALVSGDAETHNGECASPTIKVDCGEPKTQRNFYGFKSDSPLFTTDNIEAECKDYGKDIFKAESTKQAYVPFTGGIRCNDDENEVITGFELCKKDGNIQFIAVNCTQLEEGYSIQKTQVAGESNDPNMHGSIEKVSCSENEIMTFVNLVKDEESGNIYVYVNCYSVDGL